MQEFGSRTVLILLKSWFEFEFLGFRYDRKRSLVFARLLLGFGDDKIVEILAPID